MKLIRPRLLLMLPLTLLMAGCAEDRLNSPGVVDGNLSPCPDSPNCVSSRSADKKHFIEPFHYQGEKQVAADALMSIMSQWPRSKIIISREGYIHAEVRSRLFRFVDDVEFYFDDDKKLIYVRSASRTGYYDFGANRKRIEGIRAKFVGFLSKK